MFQLHDLGWDSRFQAHLDALEDPQLVPARVASESRGHYLLFDAQGTRHGQLAGKLRHDARHREDLPAVGDWVAIRPFSPEEGLIHAVLPRRSVFSRKAAGSAQQLQIVAANLDVVFLAMALNQDFNLRRLERYLALAWESGSDPVVLLTKADLCTELDARVAEVEAIAGIAPVLVTSSLTGSGIEPVRALIPRGRTAGLLGSSGAGKSTLINSLLGHTQLATGAIREDDGRGRHTTTRRELMRMPEGGLILDTPGMRELGLWDAGSGLEATFADVEALASACRFRDCGHAAEPGCAVRDALADGSLQPERLESYRKLLREQAHQAIREDASLQREQRQQHKRLSKEIKRLYRDRD
ncbi:putative ribosome biogenesis GTPase RsgA [compost metagenome]